MSLFLLTASFYASSFPVRLPSLICSWALMEKGSNLIGSCLKSSDTLSCGLCTTVGVHVSHFPPREKWAMFIHPGLRRSKGSGSQRVLIKGMAGWERKKWGEGCWKGRREMRWLEGVAVGSVLWQQRGFGSPSVAFFFLLYHPRHSPLGGSLKEVICLFSVALFQQRLLLAGTSRECNA